MPCQNDRLFIAIFKNAVLWDSQLQTTETILGIVGQK